MSNDYERYDDCLVRFVSCVCVRERERDGGGEMVCPQQLSIVIHGTKYAKIFKPH
jgi:hypothetical protein